MAPARTIPIFHSAGRQALFSVNGLAWFHHASHIWWSAPHSTQLRGAPLRIAKTRILNEDLYLSEILLGQSFRLITPVTDDRLSRAGFSEAVAIGTTLLPSIVGGVTRFNAEGRWMARRDQPKENRYLGSRIIPRKEWHGTQQVDVESLVDIYRQCYPRDFIAPPALELTVIELDGQRFFCTPATAKGRENGAACRHAINVMLELFREAEIVREDLDRLDPPAIRRANWTFLPPGEHPFERVAAHIDRTLAKRPLVARFARERQKFIVGLEPDRVFKGEGGFGDYFAYVFEARGLTVLESITVGNALYVLSQNWEATSRLSKAEILRAELHRDRIVHAKGWQARLVATLDT